MKTQKKRITALCLAALLIVPVLACGAAAAETYVFEWMPPMTTFSDSVIFESYNELYLYDGLLPPGSYNMYSYIDGVILAVSVSPIVITYDNSDIDAEGTCFTDYYAKIIGDGDEVVPCTMYVAQIGDVTGARIEVYGEPFYIEGSYYELVPVVDGGVADDVSGALESVIEWVGIVVNSLMSGSLTPLLVILCVPISVTALVISIKAIRRTSWAA